MNRRLAWFLPLAALLIAAVWLVAFRGNLSSETQQLRQQTRALEAQIRSLNTTKDSDSPKRTVAQWESMLEDVRSRYLRPAPANDLFEIIDQAANEAGLQVQRLDVRSGDQPTDEQPGTPMAQTASITAEGSFDRLYAFLAAISQGRPYLYVTLADLSVVDSSGPQPVLSLRATIVGRIAPTPTNTNTNTTSDAERSSP